MDNKWKNRFIEAAKMVGSWSKDPSTKVGAVLVNPETRTIISTGYNGFPRGVGDYGSRLDDREVKYKLVVHAEANAITQAARDGISTVGSWLFISPLPPCSSCAGLLAQAGITKVLISHEDFKGKNARWVEDYQQNTSTIFKESGIDLEIVYERDES